MEIQECPGDFGGHREGEEFLQEVYSDKLYLLTFLGGWRLSIWSQLKASFRSSGEMQFPFSAASGAGEGLEGTGLMVGILVGLLGIG